MTSAFDFKKLRRLIKVYSVVQVMLFLLLVYVAVHFQEAFKVDPYGNRFLKSVVVTLMVQLGLFFLINMFARKQAEREVEASAIGLSADVLKEQRKKRLIGDVVKVSVFIFYCTFIYKVPQNRFILSISFFSFILTILTYFQCFNFAARRKMREKE